MDTPKPALLIMQLMKPLRLAISILFFMAACQEKPVATEGRGIPPYVPPPADAPAVSTATAASSTSSGWSTVPAPTTAQPVTTPAAGPVSTSPPVRPAPLPAVTPPLAPRSETAARISVANLQQVMASAPPVILDVRSPEQFRIEHIPGAINIPLESLQARMSEIPKGKPIVAYCT